MPDGGDESRGQMPHPKNTTKFVVLCEMRECFVTKAFLIIHVIVPDLKFPNL